MGRHKIKVNDPEAATKDLVERACSLFEAPYDDRFGREPDLPTLRYVSEEMETTILRTRKLLITGAYFSTALSRQIHTHVAAGESIEKIMEEMQLGRASVYSYLPYTGIAFNLPAAQRTSNADRHRLYRKRIKAVEELKNMPSSINLWKAIVLFQNYQFTTSGRGSTEGVKFRYTVSKGGTAGKQYAGENIEGWGNEILIEGHDKSVSRSSVDYALKIAMENEITGPKQLKIFGASYVYAIFKRFGLV